MASNKRFPAVLMVMPLLATSLACGSSAGGAAVDAAPAADAAIDSVSAPPDASRASDASAGGDAALAATCGGFVGATCANATYCTWTNYSCGGGDQTGTCAERPVGCTSSYAPVCACDRKTYSNECTAAEAGQDLNAGEGCPPPAGMFSCGTTFCTHGTQYCQKTYGGAFTTPPTFTCHPIPASCGSSPTCGCFSNEPCGSNCNQPTAGDFVLTCLFP